MEIDAAIDALLAALAARGFETPRPPEGDDALRALEAEIAPLRVPSDVRRWWERVDAWTLPDLAFPELNRPDEALDAWREVRDQFRSSQPMALAHVGYESWNCLAVELDAPGVLGGAIYRYDYGGNGYRRVAPRFADWLERLTRLVAEGLDEDEIEKALEDGDRVETVAEPLYAWPRHWQVAAGLEPEDLEPPRGATTTLKALLETDPAAPATATLAGRLEIDAIDEDDPDAGVRVKLDDGTKKVVLHGAGRFFAWEVWGKWAAFEIDVSLTPGKRRRRHLDAIATIDAIRFDHELDAE